MHKNNLIKATGINNQKVNSLSLLSEYIFDIKDQLALIYDRMVKDNFYLSAESYSALIVAENILKLLQTNYKRYNFDGRKVYLNQNGLIYVDTGLLIHIIDVVQRINEQANKFLLESYFNSMKTEDILNTIPFSCNSSEFSLPSLEIKKSQQDFLNINRYCNEKPFPVPECLLEVSKKGITELNSPTSFESKPPKFIIKPKMSTKTLKSDPNESESLLSVKKRYPSKTCTKFPLKSLQNPSFETSCTHLEGYDLFECNKRQKKTFLNKFSSLFKRKMGPTLVDCSDSCTGIEEEDCKECNLNSKISKCSEIKSNETTNLLYTTVDGNGFCISIKIKPQYSQKGSNIHSSPKHVHCSTTIKESMLEQRTEDLIRNQLSKKKRNGFRDRLIRQFSKLSIDNIIRIRKRKHDAENDAIFNAIFRRSRTFEERSSLNTMQYKVNNQNKYSTDYYISLGNSYDTSTTCSWILSTPQIYCCEIKCNNNNVMELKYKFDFYINLTKDMPKFNENSIYEVYYFEVKKYFKCNESQSTNESVSHETEKISSTNKQILNKSEKNDKQTYLNIYKYNLERFKNLCKSTDEESDASEALSEEKYNHLLHNFKLRPLNKDFYVIQPTPIKVNTLFKQRRKRPEFMLSRSKSLFSVSDFDQLRKLIKKHNNKSNELNSKAFREPIQNNVPKKINFEEITTQINSEAVSCCKPTENLKGFIISQPNVEAGMEINDVDIKINEINKNLHCFEKALKSMTKKIDQEKSIQTDNENKSEYSQTNKNLSKNNFNQDYKNMIPLMDNDNLENLILFLESIRKQFKNNYSSSDYENLIRLQDTQYYDEIIQLNENYSRDIMENDYVVYQCTCDCSSRQSVFQRFWNKSKNVMPKCQREYEPSVQLRYEKSRSSLGCAHSCDFNHLCQNCGLYIKLKGCTPTPYTKFCSCLNKSKIPLRPVTERANKGTDPLISVPDGVFCKLSSKNFNPCQCEDNTKICHAYKLQLCTCSNKFTSVGCQIEPEMEDRLISTTRALMEDATSQFIKYRKNLSLQTLTDCQCNNCAPKQEKEEDCDCPTVVKCGSKSDVGINCDCPLTEQKNSESQADGDQNKNENNEKSTEIPTKDSKTTNKTSSKSDIKSKESDKEELDELNK